MTTVLNVRTPDWLVVKCDLTLKVAINTDVNQISIEIG
jgi:hypothetical protein